MTCKNCNTPLEKNALFCDNCGAKVVTSRITFKLLTTDLFVNVFGIDSKFFLTLRKMLTHPQEVINEYITGVRKRYVNPFAFLAIAAAISLLIFNYFADDFIRIQSNVNSQQLEKFKEAANKDINSLSNISDKELKKLKSEKKVAQFQLKLVDNMQQFMLRYYNLLTFVFLFIYAILSKWTYWKPHNFGEHIVINAYTYGFATYFTTIAFLIAMIIHPSIYVYSMFIYIIYYLYVFGKLYKQGFGKGILKLLRFILGLLIFTAITIPIIALIGFLIGIFGFI
ncbi:DUF3667 domain-containing protein [Polaribacter sp. Hel1_85]|uniref:DUF3667 domain-containing protein n=1 Tax=Polaribacter sp. Hel1_85 TaxID=1250005 RepID=UPI00052B8446|nr:DUF3667 domain-containing protein [Polaribacter sp. Hel1_85]KGL58713.1 conserved hypothetical membrane protein [Polaribacter sp. Hel1_85]